MQATKVIKSKPVEVTRKSLEGPSPVKLRAGHVARRELKVPAARNRRARGAQLDRREGAPSCCERRSRSSSTAPKRTTDPDYRRATSSSVKRAAVTPEGRETSVCPGQRGQQQGVRAHAGQASESHKAFTVIPPNPKKRREIQRSGSLSLEEVRLKQQQEMMQTKRRQKPGKQLEEKTAVLRC